MRALARPFPADKISWRVGATNATKDKGIALAYIDARDVMERLDEVFGMNWQCRYTHAEAKTICEIGVRIDDEWIWRAGGAGDTDVEAEKGAVSDAFKRAAVLLRIGQYLYKLPNTWVAIEPSGKSYKLKVAPSLPYWATPEGYDANTPQKNEPPANRGKPASNPDLKPDRDEEVYLLSVVDGVKSCGVGFIEAYEFLQKEGLDTDEKTWVWNKLPSATRTAITLHVNSLKEKKE